jgi:hypothetical protein
MPLCIDSDLTVTLGMLQRIFGREWHRNHRSQMEMKRHKSVTEGRRNFLAKNAGVALYLYASLRKCVRADRPSLSCQESS